MSSTQSQTQAKAAMQPSRNATQSGILQRKCDCGQHTIAGEECEECRQQHKGMIQRAAVSSAPVNTVPPIVHDVLSSPGQWLDADTRSFMEPRFGHDFSQVRVHTDEKAAESAQTVNALAYTVGRDMVFGTGEYTPETSEGKRLLAHELTHVVQQSSGQQRMAPSSLHIASSDDPAEREAHLASQNLHVAQSIKAGQVQNVLHRQVTEETRHTVKNLTAVVDPVNPALIVFNRPVTLNEAIEYLWTRPPETLDAIKPDPSERTKGERQHRYLINTKSFDLLFSLQHGLADVYVKRIRPIMAKGEAKLPPWVPSHIQDDIWNGRLTKKVTRYPGTAPWGNIVVWYDRSGGFIDVQVYQDFPDNLDFYLKVTQGDKHQARLLQKVYTEFNRDMMYFVEGQAISPSHARDEIRRINDELFKLVIEASVAILTSGAAISAINSSARQVAATAERTGLRSVAGTVKEEAEAATTALKEETETGVATVKQEAEAATTALKEETETGVATVKQEAETGASTVKGETSVKPSTQSTSTLTSPTRKPGEGINVKASWGNPKSQPAYGHSLSEHGPQRPANQLVDRASGTGNTQGQWYDENFIVEAEQRAPLTPGPHDIDMGKPVGRLYHPDGSVTEGVSTVRVVRRQNLTVNTSFPVGGNK